MPAESRENPLLKKGNFDAFFREKCLTKNMFLFCGKRSGRIKGLLWEGDGFLLLYKRLDNGAFNWPRTADEVLEITPEQYRMLMQGLEVIARRPIQEVSDPPRAM